MGNIELYEIELLDDFKSEARRLTKKKNFKTLPDQIDELIDKIERGEFEGDKITHRNSPTPYDVYKLRLPNLDTGAGKSNGYRIIYMVVTEVKVVVFVTIYYKKEQANVSDKYITGLIDGYFLNSMPEESGEGENGAS
jgi:mRNA-degrading endonuclease RelE of RelBE toxin-antitoxin system